LLVILSLLILYNIWTTISYGILIEILPVTMQTVLIYLLISRNQYAQKSIKIWAIIFTIISPLLLIIGRLLQVFGDILQEKETIEILTSSKIQLSFIMFILGIIIFFLNKHVGYTESEAQDNLK